MISRIKVIVVDKDYKSHDYKGVKSYKYTDNSETGFDFIFLTGNENIEKVLSENRDFDVILTIEDKNSLIFKTLNTSTFQFRKKWIHLDKFDKDDIAWRIICVFVNNLNRKQENDCKLFSFFTCTFNTPKEYIYRLYTSMLNQTYKEWNWYVLDDSTNDNVIDTINGLNDSRIIVIKNITNHGSIGFNKHTIAMMCNGDYLVEVDHDDELTTDCLYWLKTAFDTYEDTDFVYSDALELMNNESVRYGKGWGWGEGSEREEYVNSALRIVSVVPEINPFSIRTIYAQPNHVRCWKKDFYHKIGGHNINLGVLDDMDILIRTFLYGKMTKVNKVLYIQYEGNNGRENGDTTQGKRFYEIQRTCFLLKELYDRKIHERILSLGFSDYAWDEKIGSSDLGKNHIPGLEVMSYLVEP